VNSQDAFTSATYAIDQNVGEVLSISYGACEAETPSTQIEAMNSVFQQANAQGITVVAASGDQGAADCDEPVGASGLPPSSASRGLAVDFPGSSPYVTGAGGTEFNENGQTYWSASNNSNAGSALSYIPEIAWNDTAADGYLSASGGGASALFAKPSWQKGTGVPADGFRDVPDIALSASPDHDPYLICSAGWCTNGFRDSQTYLDTIGGTSAAVPTFAGIVALINQKTHSSQGNINPALYALASATPGAFHDITAGSNVVPCVVGTPDCADGSMGYTAGPGYDQVTGLGSVDTYNLVSALDGIEQVAPVVISDSGEFFAPSQGSGTVGVTATGAGSWTASTTASWITIIGAVSRTGNGTVSFTVTANTGAARSGTLTINGQTFTISQESPSSGLSDAGSMAQIASGGVWDTSLTLIDLGTASTEARIDFSGNAGSALMLPFTFPQQTFTGTMLGATLDQILNPHGQFVINTAGSSSDPVSVGWAQLSTGGAVNGFAIFENSNGQEAVVPLETRDAPSYLLAFDDTGALATGLAIANLATAAQTSTSSSATTLAGRSAWGA
jgi:subtilase family serine protease